VNPRRWTTAFAVRTAPFEYGSGFPGVNTNVHRLGPQRETDLCEARPAPVTQLLDPDAVDLAASDASFISQYYYAISHPDINGRRALLRDDDGASPRGRQPGFSTHYRRATQAARACARRDRRLCFEPDLSIAVIDIG